MSETNNCKNCSFFREHYAKNDDGQLYALGIGHCENKKIGIMSFKRCMQYNTACAYWKNAEKPAQEEQVADTIKQTARYVKLIAEHLNIDITEKP